MKKCPRCGKELNDDKFCPHCGLDLQQYKSRGPKNKSMTYLLYVIIFFSFITIPLLYSRFLENTVSQSPTISEEDKIELSEIRKGNPTRIVAQYTTLADYKGQFSNVSSYIQSIEDYELKISEDTGYIFDKTYEISVLDNYNVYYYMTYSTQISDNLTLKVEKNFDRAHLYNNEKITVQKNNGEDFEDLIFNEDELKAIRYFVSDQKEIQKLMKDFSKRKNEFNEKKETIGHYGLGEYQDKSSFIVYKKGQGFMSEFTYIHEVKDFIA